MIVLDCIQNSPEWDAARLGIVTSSSFNKIITTTGGVSKQREKYLYTLAGQRVSGRIEETYKNADMSRGNENEEKSRSHFEYIHDVDISQVAVVYPDEEKRYCCSPDGLILEWGEGFETKDAIFSIQIARLKAHKPDPEHLCQMQFSMAVCGYKAWWYQSFCDGLSPLTLKIKRDEKYISALQKELDAFCTELDELTEWLNSPEVAA